MGMHTPRTILLQTLGHFVLGHAAPRDFADFLRQRVEANYYAAAVLVPERSASRFLREAKEARDLSVEDLRDVFSVSYEMAAHRFTNLVTHHLDLTCHFVKNDESGIIYKAYENDGVAFPADPAGAIEGQRMCRYWSGRQVFASADRFSPYVQYSDTPSGTYWCTALVDTGPERDFAEIDHRRCEHHVGAKSSEAGSLAALAPANGHRDPDDGHQRRIASKTREAVRPHVVA